MRTVKIPLETAEKIVEILPLISDMDKRGKRALYEMCSAINFTMSTVPFRPTAYEANERKIQCIKAWRLASKDENGVLGLKESKEAVERRDWIEIYDIDLYKEALRVFEEADVTIEYKDED